MTAPRPRPVLTDAPVCPLCGKPVRHETPRSGDGWMEHTPRVWVGSRNRHKFCPAVWWNMTLPPGTTGADLRDQLGAEETAALLRAALPEWRALDDDALWAAAIVPADAEQPGWLQLLFPPGDVARYRFARLRDILLAAGVLRSA